jgi:hypothetical protein
MELGAITAIAQQFGALGIILLMVWKSPAILEKLTGLIQLIIGHVRDSQKEALSVFKSELEKLIDLFTDRFKVVEETLTKNCEAQTQLIGEIKTLSERMRNLEDAKPHSS